MVQPTEEQSTIIGLGYYETSRKSILADKVEEFGTEVRQSSPACRFVGVQS